MPWKESDKMSERMAFITRYRAGERITDLCREFEISRPTGYALVKRYEESGVTGLRDRSSRPRVSPSKTPRATANEVIKLRKKYPTWGPRKLKQRLHVLHPEVRWPASSTIGAILSDEGLTKRRARRRRATPSGTPLRQTSEPNELWCMDFKGQFRLGNRSYCYPLTISDHYSRYLTTCEALDCTKTADTELALNATFREFGLPLAIRSDNGSPFASTGRLGLSRLSVWLLRLGIDLERIEPGHPEQNGRHERMHLTLKQDATRPPATHQLKQQEKFDTFRRIYNEERPHEALQMKTPGSVYRPSKRRLPEGLAPLDYPLHDHVSRVARNGVFHFTGVGHVYLGMAFAGQEIGLRELQTGTWLVSFMETDIGYLDVETKQIIDISAT